MGLFDGVEDVVQTMYAPGTSSGAVGGPVSSAGGSILGNVGGAFSNPSGMVTNLTGGNLLSGILNPNLSNNFQASGTAISGIPIAQGVGVDQAQQAAAQQQGAMGNSQAALGQQAGLAQALQNQNGIGNQSNVYNQLQGVANGTGPNPAQAMFNQATGNNVANQAALMASQRGAGQNVGLMGRQAAQQGAGIQQNAAGQAATMQAQQQLGALGQMGGVANQQAANQIGSIGNLNQYAQGQQGLAQQNQANLLNSINAQNNAGVSMQSNLNNSNVGMQENQNTVNAQTQEANAKNKAGIFGGLINAGGGALAAVLYKGGEVGSGYPSHLQDIHKIYHGDSMKMKSGGPVPGKAQVKGDSPKNDTVKALLSPGEVVIPKSVMESKDPVSGASQFVAALLKKKGESGGSSEKDFKEALGRAIQGRKKK